MSGLEFVASLVNSLAWPCAAIGAVFVLRAPLKNAINRRLRRAKFGPAEFEFDVDKVDELRAEVEGEQAAISDKASGDGQARDGEHVEEQQNRIASLAALAEQSPSGAYLTQYIELERTLRDLVQAPNGRPLYGRRLADEAVKQDVMSPAELEAFVYLSTVRNQAVHGVEDLTPAQAVELGTLAMELTFVVQLRHGFQTPTSS